MAIIPTVGRRNWSLRILIASLYVILSVGAVTMVYPFLLMVFSGMTSRVDVNSYSVIPRYFWDEDMLFAKYADEKYQGDIEAINRHYRTDFAKLEDIKPPKLDPTDPKVEAMVEDWWRFSSTIPVEYKEPCFQGLGKSYSKIRRMYQEWLRRKFGNDLDALNRRYVEENESFLDIYLPFERHQRREWQPEESPKMRDWLRYKRTLPQEMLQIFEADPLYSAFLKEDRYEETSTG